MSIAPHLNNEVRLVLGGLKPLATIEKGKDSIGYSLAIALSNAGMLYKECAPTLDSPTGEVIITLPGRKELVTEYKDLLTNGIDKYGLKDYHRRMGKLFGYSDKDIEDFINAEISCDCSKCRGK